MALPEITAADIDEVLQQAPGVAALAQSPDSIDGDPNLQNFLAAMDATNFTAPFDWQAEFGDRKEDLENSNVVDTADLELLRMIMTAHIRIDRFDNGHLARLIRSSYWTRCIDRLRQLRTSI